ncbi:MAG: hypothetical protein ACE5NC_05390 [Anaerolineae bacterium]
MTWKRMSWGAPDEGGRAIRLSGTEFEFAEALLDKGPMGPRGLVREVGFSSDYARILCRSMLTRGVLRSVGGGRYDLTPSVRASLQAKKDEAEKQQEQKQKQEREEDDPWPKKPLR